MGQPLQPLVKACMEDMYPAKERWRQQHLQSPVVVECRKEVGKLDR